MGKTVFAVELLRNQSAILDKSLDKILWVSRFEQIQLKKKLRHLNIEFIKNSILTMNDITKKRGTADQLLIVFDDLMELVNKSNLVSGLIKHGRHIGISVFFLTQKIV